MELIIKLENIEIKNYRCIEHIKIPIRNIKGGYTFCLFGINESGKSSFLKGLSLFDQDDLKYPDDFFNDSLPITIIFHYKTNSEDLKNLKDEFVSKFNSPKEFLSLISFSKVTIDKSFDATLDPKESTLETIDFKKNEIKGFKLVENKIIASEPTDKDTFDLSEFMRSHLSNYFWNKSHNIVFWKSTEKYLIQDEIDLTTFQANPEEISLPLSNSFKLAGIEKDNIADKITNLTSASSISNLESLLSEKVTNHINNVWVGHPIKIKFKINNNTITLLVEDDGVKHKAKTTGQRSDGFRQFVSFLLSVSAEFNNNELSNTVMLIDEPETHLHPKAQLDLMKELIKISGKNNNIVFYATHSNYMIDKKLLERNIKVQKKDNEKTSLEFISQNSSSYSEVNYTIFNIPTTDYHNELYGYLEAVKNTKFYKLPKKIKWKNELSGKTEKVSLPKYIRNSIHHPENSSNKAYSERQLKNSIELLRKLKYE